MVFYTFLLLLSKVFVKLVFAWPLRTEIFGGNRPAFSGILCELIGPTLKLGRLSITSHGRANHILNPEMEIIFDRIAGST